MALLLNEDSEILIHVRQLNSGKGFGIHVTTQKITTAPASHMVEVTPPLTAEEAIQRKEATSPIGNPTPPPADGPMGPITTEVLKGAVLTNVLTSALRPGDIMKNGEIVRSVHTARDEVRVTLDRQPFSPKTEHIEVYPPTAVRAIWKIPEPDRNATAVTDSISIAAPEYPKASVLDKLRGKSTHEPRIRLTIPVAALLLGDVLDHPASQLYGWKIIAISVEPIPPYMVNTDYTPKTVLKWQEPSKSAGTSRQDVVHMDHTQLFTITRSKALYSLSIPPKATP